MERWDAGEGPMLTRYLERRQYLRVPVHGPARWRCGNQTGPCELTDISPGGAGLQMTATSAARLSPRVSVDIELSPGCMWTLVDDARIVRQTLDKDGRLHVGLALDSPTDFKAPTATVP